MLHCQCNAIFTYTTGIEFAISSNKPFSRAAGITERKRACTHTLAAHVQSRSSRGIDVGGHYHIARLPIVVIHRRICIGFAFGQESRSPHFVLRRRMAGPSCSFLGSVRAEPGVSRSWPDSLPVPSARSKKNRRM